MEMRLDQEYQQLQGEGERKKSGELHTTYHKGEANMEEIFLSLP